MKDLLGCTPAKQNVIASAIDARSAIPSTVSRWGVSNDVTLPVQCVVFQNGCATVLRF